MSKVQWLTIHAGGRREVLRRLPLALSCPDLRDGVGIQDFHFQWENDQPSLRLALFLNGNQNLHQTIAQIEQTLDAVMALYPWEEQPVLDWTGTSVPRRLSVTVDTAPDGVKPPSACPPEVMKKIFLLLEQDGTAIKKAWMHVMHLAIKMHLGLHMNQHELFECIPEDIRALIPAKLAWIERNTVLDYKNPPLWETTYTLMQSMDIDKQKKLLQSVAGRLSFRPDEQAYLILVASVIKSHPNGDR